MLTTVLGSYRRHRFAWLFFSLLLTLGSRPALETLVSGFNPLELLLALNLIAAVASAAHERWLRVLLLLSIAFVATRGIRVVLGVEAMLPVSQAFWVTACLLAMAATARHALRAVVVDAEHIFAALDAYLLAGLIFGVCYWLLDQTWPASFGVAAESDLDLARAIYFSFVTVATVGYGDVVPASDSARGLAILEAVGGQMYLAVLVARLVSLYSKQADE
jgi:voltage-gated potassium channel Kch